jgi:hypothetical protein
MSDSTDSNRSDRTTNVAQEAIRGNVTTEMERVKNDRDYLTKMHKDPLVEANYYLARNDVYELFKVSFIYST